MRIALLSNVTVDILAEMVKNANDVYLPVGFDTWRQEILNPASALYEYKPESVVVLLHSCVYDWRDRNIDCQLIDEWIFAFKTLTETLPNVPLFVSSIDMKIYSHYGAEHRIEEYLENYLISGIEELHQLGKNIYVLPVKEVILEMGRSTFYSPKMWYMGSMPYSMKGIRALLEMINRYTGAIKGMHKKCIAVDLDNTLWGGVIGEDGVEGIELSEYKEGARYKDTQKILKKMKDQGVMLAILSKNNIEDVESVYKHPDMVLQHEDFVGEVINWEPKSMNIRRLAKDLNIGLDAFAFLDDNPVEREQMKAECPEVAVIDFPEDSSLLPEIVEKAYHQYFLSLEVTGEDARKTDMYRAESQRKTEMSASTSVEEFLKKLEMKMMVHCMLPEEIKRVVQLVNKTNQFNVTTKRYSEEEIKTLADCGDIITVYMSDKYGNQGLVSVLILTYENDQAYIDTFLMSCRVMGRNAENEIIGRIKNMLECNGIREIKASYIKTAKNLPVEYLFEKLGFAVTNQSEGNKEYICLVESLPTTTGLFKEIEELE